MKKLQRDARIKLSLVGDNSWEIQDKDGNLLVSNETDFLIYLQGVNFRRGNSIDGVYLGTLNRNSALLKVESAKVVSIDGRRFLVDNEQIKTAKMVIVDNKKNVIIVIPNSR